MRVIDKVMENFLFTSQVAIYEGLFCLTRSLGTVLTVSKWVTRRNMFHDHKCCLATRCWKSGF